MKWLQREPNGKMEGITGWVKGTGMGWTRQEEDRSKWRTNEKGKGSKREFRRTTKEMH